MHHSNLAVGRTYYRLTFADPSLTMPGLEPLVYVGLHESEGKLLHTFQDTISYSWVGRYPGPFLASDDIEVHLFPMTENEADQLHCLEEVVIELQASGARAKQLGHPMLNAAVPKPKPHAP